MKTTIILSDNEVENTEPDAGQENAVTIGGTPAADPPAEDTNSKVGSAEVSVVSPQSELLIIDKPEDIMCSTRKKLGSIRLTRSSRRRAGHETRVFEE